MPPSASGAPVLLDPGLPGLAVLLDPGAMGPFLQRGVGDDTPLTDVRVHHVRYAPGRKLTVRYDVGIDGRRRDAVAMIAATRYLAARAVKPENVALAALVGERSPARMPLRYEPDLEALIQWYPLDLELPALAEPPSRLVDELRATGARVGRVASDPVTLAYRPGRRAVIRVGDRVLKIYGRSEDFEAASANLAAAVQMPGVRTAALDGSLPARLVTAQPLLPGSPPGQAADVARAAGALLRELHGAGESGLSAAPPSRQLAITRSAASFVAAILPALGRRVAALVGQLEARAPSIDRLVASHGDFSARQLLETPDGLAVVDLDALCLAPAALDPATFAAHVVAGGPEDLDEAGDVLERLLEGYGPRPAGLSWYLAACILRHARAPFRYQDEHWPARVEGMIGAAETALRG